MASRAAGRCVGLRDGGFLYLVRLAVVKLLGWVKNVGCSAGGSCCSPAPVPGGRSRCQAGVSAALCGRTPAGEPGMEPVCMTSL